MSTNMGGAWSDVTANMTNKNTYSLVLTKNYIIAGNQSGIWRRPLSDLISGVNDNRASLPETPTLARNYPNPFSRSTTFTFTLPSRMPASLRVYSLLGREIATLADGEYEAGAHTVSFDAAARTLPSCGVYIYRLAAGATLLSGKMVLMR